MNSRIPKKRDRIFIAVEGEAEQAFVKLLQIFANKMHLNIHLDCHVLCGGGYEIMLNKAIYQRKKRERTRAKSSILLLDSDRSIKHDDSWTDKQLINAANKHHFIVCLQNPNFEGLLIKFLSKTDKIAPDQIKHQLNKLWPEYKKPADTYTLAHKISFNNLIRVCQKDNELKKLLTLIGFPPIES